MCCEHLQYERSCPTAPSVGVWLLTPYLKAKLGVTEEHKERRHISATEGATPRNGGKHGLPGAQDNGRLMKESVLSLLLGETSGWASVVGHAMYLSNMPDLDS